MKRFMVIERIVKRLLPTDIAIFEGNELCKEAFKYDREGNFYIRDLSGISISIGIGIANSVKNRVFVFSNDNGFLSEVGSLIQMHASRINNLFFVLLIDNLYQSSGNFPNIFSSINSIKGALFEVGLLVYDFNYFFKDNVFLKTMFNFMIGLKGPGVIIVNVDKGLKKNLKDVNISNKNLVIRCNKFIQQTKE